ncbi:MAG: hypothetical protein ABIE07_00895 [Candidatus Zixiibacteriota bacterium]
MNRKNISQEVIDRLLMAKSLLGTIESIEIENPDKYIVAHNILTAHDATELAIAGVAHHEDKLPQKKTFLSYFEALKNQIPNMESHISYFTQLNSVRVGIKHTGSFPDSS